MRKFLLYIKTQENVEKKGIFIRRLNLSQIGPKGIVDQWNDLALQWMKDEKPKNLHPSQIINTAENIEMISIQAFFPESSYKRFISHSQSVHYVLVNVLNQISEQTAETE